MNPNWFGDSYDLVKRFFLDTLRGLSYSVYVDPMPSGEWDAVELAFLKLLRVQHVRDAGDVRESALFLDPDIGISSSAKKTHTSVATMIERLERHAIVFAFDQSFSRSIAPMTHMSDKLLAVRALGAYGFYYDSHARFLFTSHSSQRLQALREALISEGLPAQRLICGEDAA